MSKLEQLVEPLLTRTKAPCEACNKAGPLTALALWRVLQQFRRGCSASRWVLWVDIYSYSICVQGRLTVQRPNKCLEIKFPLGLARGMRMAARNRTTSGWTCGAFSYPHLRFTSTPGLWQSPIKQREAQVMSSEASNHNKSYLEKTYSVCHSLCFRGILSKRNN